MIGNYRGIDWNVYVRLRNEERKKGNAPKRFENDENILLDEIEQEEEKTEENAEVNPDEIQLDLTNVDDGNQ